MTQRDADVQAGHTDEGDDIVAPLGRHFLWMETPAGVSKLIRWLFYLCVFLFLVDIPWPRHAYVPGEGLWGFYAIAGFVAFTLIVLGASKLRTFIKRDETFYAPYSIDAEAYPDRDLAMRQSDGNSGAPEEREGGWLT